MRTFSFSLPLTFCVYIAGTSSSNNGVSGLAMPTSNSRRGFLNRAASVATGTTMGWLLTQQENSGHVGGCACGQCGGGVVGAMQQHSASCSCGMCGSSSSHVAGCQCGSCVASSHEAGCSCGSCSSNIVGGHDASCGCGQCGSGSATLASTKFGMRPTSANAYEKRVIGGDTRSANTAAYNIQSEKTYARLEKSGFPLDTSADEKARLSDALSGYSYSSTPTSNTGKKSNDKAKK